MTNDMIEHMRVLRDKRNSLSYWYPKIQGLVRTPETIIMPFDFMAYWKLLDGAPIPKEDVERFHAAANKLGYPVFMRTSQSSDKHSWKDTCFVKDKKSLKRNLFNLIEHDAMVDLFPDAIVFRKYIPMESYFTAWWGDFPVNKEFRCFIRDGKIECIHPYWPKAAIEQGSRWIKDKDWESKFQLLTAINDVDVLEISAMLNKITLQFSSDWWSVDFAKSKAGEWYLIDMALGAVSYHYEGCKFAPRHA